MSNPAPEQPDWLKLFSGGIQGGHNYKVYKDGTKYAVVVRPGHTSYVDRMSGNRYCPTMYVLIEKDKDYWQNIKKEVHEGRLTKEAAIKIQKVLEEAEASL